MGEHRHEPLALTDRMVFRLRIDTVERPEGFEEKLSLDYRLDFPVSLVAPAVEMLSGILVGLPPVVRLGPWTDDE